MGCFFRFGEHDSEDGQAQRHGGRLGQGDTGHYVENLALFSFMGWMARIDWGECGNATQSKDRLEERSGYRAGQK